MSQTVVNFLTASGPPTSVTLVTDPRVFNFEIDQTSQLYYIQQMQELQNDLATVPPTNATLQDISTILNNLNNWSGMISVQSHVPVINPVTGVITGYTTAQTYSINGNEMPVTANGTIVPVKFDSSGQIILDGNGAATILTTANGANGPEFIASNGTVLTSTMNQYMAQDLDQIIRTFRAAGWDPTENPVGSAFYNATTSQNAITTIQGSPAVYGLLDFTNPATGATNSGLITQALTAAASANITGQESATQSNNIQQLLMVGYIATGNQILSNQLSQLQNAINTNQSVLSYLNALQDLMNKKSPQQFILQLQDLNNLGSEDPSTQLSNVNNFENQSYNQAINVVSNITGSSPTAIQDYLAAAAGLQANITIQNNLTSSTYSNVLSGLGSVVQDPTSVNGAEALSGLNTAINTVVANAVPIPPQTNNDNIVEPLTFAQLQALGFGTAIFERELVTDNTTHPATHFIQREYVFQYDTAPETLATRLQTLITNASLTPSQQAYFSSTSPVPITPVTGVAIPAGWSNPPTVLQYMSYQLAANFSSAHISTFPISPAGTASGVYLADLTNLSRLFLSNTTTGPAGMNLGSALQTITPDQATLLSQAWALSELASDMAAASASGPIDGLTSSDPTAMQAALQTIITGDILLTADQRTYLTDILPALVQNIASNNAPLNSASGSLAAGAFAHLSTSMSTVFTYTKAQIIANLQYLSKQITAQGGPAGGPLSSSINQILQDFQSANSINSWIQDGGASGTSALSTQGNYQNDLTNAQTAAQSFNQTQQETLSEVMFTFEEFYKSASGMLSSLDQLLQKMADAISRS